MDKTSGVIEPMLLVWMQNYLQEVVAGDDFPTNGTTLRNLQTSVQLCKVFAIHSEIKIVCSGFKAS